MTAASQGGDCAGTWWATAAALPRRERRKIKEACRVVASMSMDMRMLSSLIFNGSLNYLWYVCGSLLAGIDTYHGTLPRSSIEVLE